MTILTALINTKEQKISLDKAKKFVYSSENGAETIFVGRVRNINDNKKVTAVTYDAHDEAVLKSFKIICTDAKNRIF